MIEHMHCSLCGRDMPRGRVVGWATFQAVMAPTRYVEFNCECGNRIVAEEDAGE